MKELNHFCKLLFTKIRKKSFIGNFLKIITQSKKIEKIDIFGIGCTHTTKLYQSQFSYNWGVIVFYFTISAITPHLNFSNNSAIPIPIPMTMRSPPNAVIPSDVPKASSANLPPVYAENPRMISNGGVPYATALADNAIFVMALPLVPNRFFVRSHQANLLRGESSSHISQQDKSNNSQKLNAGNLLIHPSKSVSPFCFTFSRGEQNPPYTVIISPHHRSNKNMTNIVSDGFCYFLSVKVSRNLFKNIVIFMGENLFDFVISLLTILGFSPVYYYSLRCPLILSNLKHLIYERT